MLEIFLVFALLLLSTGAFAGSPAALPDTTRDSAGRAVGEITVPPSQMASSGDIPDLRDIHFALDRSDLRLEDRQTLASNADWLKAHSDVNITIEGDADERGGIVYNLALSDQRAIVTRDALIALGVSPERIVFSIGWGKLYPICQQLDESCWSANRRAHFARW